METLTETIPPIEAAPESSLGLEPRAKKIFVQLGRAGDILNVLPLAELEYRTDGRRPWFMVARAYAGLLEGVSYVVPVIFEGPFELVIPALIIARRLTENVVLTQIYGAGIRSAMLCTSFARESWWSGGARVPWGSLPLTIDRRDRNREALLISRVLGPHYGKKIVLVAATGTSSPFPYRPALLSALRASLTFEFAIVDLSLVVADRFFDLLGLFEKAWCLVSIDTGHLHLAHACAVPVIAIVTRDPSPWHGSPWRPNHRARFFYDEFPRCLTRLEIAVQYGREPQRYAQKIIHVWADWRENEPSDDVKRRTSIAQSSWETEYAHGCWVPREMPRAAGRRDGRSIGDPHPVPFVHDLIEYALDKSTNGRDIICLTNADIGFTPGLTGKIFETVYRNGGSAFSHRRDFEAIAAPFYSEAQVGRGDWYPGTDLVCFTVDWWKSNMYELGDYVMGREFWDEAFRQLIKYHSGGALLAACWHEWHISYWCDTGRETLPGNVYNAKLRARWFEQTGFVPEDFRYFRTVEDGAIHPEPYDVKRL